MSDSEPELLCRRCHRPVRIHRDDYRLFEGMHYVCFHYEFEHELRNPGTDPDEDCGDPGCPSASLSRDRRTAEPGG